MYLDGTSSFLEKFYSSTHLDIEYWSFSFLKRQWHLDTCFSEDANYGMCLICQSPFSVMLIAKIPESFRHWFFSSFQPSWLHLLSFHLSISLDRVLYFHSLSFTLCLHFFHSLILCFPGYLLHFLAFAPFPWMPHFLFTPTSCLLLSVILCLPAPPPFLLSAVPQLLSSASYLLCYPMLPPTSCFPIFSPSFLSSAYVIPAVCVSLSRFVGHFSAALLLSCFFL